MSLAAYPRAAPASPCRSSPSPRLTSPRPRASPPIEPIRPKASLARYRENPAPSVDASLDATDGSVTAPGLTRPDPNEPARMSEEYVSRLEGELAALKASVQTMPSPAKQNASPPDGPAPPRATETGDARASGPASIDRKGPARGAPPLGKATAASKTTLDEDLAKAQAKYSDDRLAKFEKAMEEKFAASGGYDSDLEREMAAAEGMPSDHELAVGKVDAGKKAKALRSEKAETDAVNAPFEKQNEWMDEYRADGGESAENAPISGVANLAARTAELVAASDDPSPPSPAAATRQTTPPTTTATTEATVAELDAARAAVAATRASAPAAAVTRARAPAAHAPSASFLGAGAHGDGLPRPDVLVRQAKRSATVPRPPSFLSRDASRAKTIAEQRLEQELAVEAALEEAELRKRVAPKPVPRSTHEPRFARMVETEAARRERNRETRKQALVETERPFSFYVRDKKKADEADPKSRSEAALKARRANKFQRRFVAKAVPKAVKELRLPSMEAEAARRKEEARIAAEIALKESKMPERMAKNVAARAGPDASGSGGSAGPAATAAVEKRRTWSFQPAPRKPVPDFDALHASFFRRLKEAKQSRPSTAVREFRLHEKSSPQRRAELSKIEKDMREDENVLPENRWPFASTRAPVRSTPPPSFEGSVRPDFLKKNENLATKLRRQAVLRAKASGHYATKEEREALELAEREAENRRRAAAWARSQTGDGRGAASLDARADVAASARRKQQSQIAKETVERVLMENNVYTYVEEGL